MAIDTLPNSVIESRQEQESITPPHGLRRAFRRMMELYKRGKPWMLVICGNEAGVRVHETLPPQWEPK